MFGIIQDYEDKIWCDVIYMNIAHIIFGRPWIFYQKVHRDKEANTYTLLWNEKSYAHSNEFNNPIFVYIITFM